MADKISNDPPGKLYAIKQVKMATLDKVKKETLQEIMIIYLFAINLTCGEGKDISLYLQYANEISACLFVGD